MRQSRYLAWGFLLIFFSSVLLAGESTAFIVIGKYERSSLSFFVGEAADKKKLIKLVYDLRDARRENRLKRMIPPTTPGGSQGDYAVMDIYIFTDSRWATSDRLKRFIRTHMDRAEDRKFEREFASHVAAHYVYNVMNKAEEGSLGLDDEMVKSAHYKRLF